jgi:hypothetical protein
VGYGRVDEIALYRSLDHAVTLIAEATIDDNRHHLYEMLVPQAFWSGRRRQRQVTVALVNAEELDTVSRAFQRNREAGMSERDTNRWLAGDKRNGRTLQVSRRHFGTAVRPDWLFVVVTRQDNPWSTGKDQPEDYALCVVLDDRANAEANLYHQVRAALRHKARVRIPACPNTSMKPHYEPDLDHQRLATDRVKGGIGGTIRPTMLMLGNCGEPTSGRCRA